jgi:uncharacterized protein YqjF (DUF2071 family)
MPSFLTAVWSDLILVSFAVPDDVLMPLVPPGLELDRLDGQAFVSVVAFQFDHMAFFGAPAPPLPYTRSFPEMNLRFYVRHGADRGVVFVREYVPGPHIVHAARMLFNEPYEAAPGASHIGESAVQRGVLYEFSIGGRRQAMAVTAKSAAMLPPEESSDPFFMQRGHGFGVLRSGETIQYRVVHPCWRVYEIGTFTFRVDFGLAFGSRWRFLQDRQPDSLILAEGSPVSLSWRSPL